MKRIFIVYVLASLNYMGCNSKKDGAMLSSVDLAHSAIIVDTHIDLPDRTLDKDFDIGVLQKEGDFDLVRAKDGGLDVAFMSIYVSSSKKDEEAYLQANRLIDYVEKLENRNPETVKIARKTEDIISNFEKGVISFPMGMENGSPINGDLENLDHFYQRGIRYITLCHNASNDICDSSTDTLILHNGLSEFGEKVVRKMNDLGIMVDVSHASDETILDVLAISSAPIFASHSSAKAITPDNPRNLSDTLILKISEKGGVIMVNFGTPFISNDVSRQFFNMKREAAKAGLEYGVEGYSEFLESYRQKYPMESTLEKVVDHIDHIVGIAGVDHVGFGSDFDGVGPFVPKGLEDVAHYPNLIEELLKRGYSELDIRKICGLNFMRFWENVEKASK